MDGLDEILKSIPVWVPWAVVGTTFAGFMAHSAYLLYTGEKASRRRFDELAQSYSNKMGKDELVPFYEELRKYAGTFIGKERMAKTG